MNSYDDVTVEQLMHEVKAFQIYDGTREIQRNSMVRERFR